MYVLLVVAGVLVFFVPSLEVLATLQRALVYTWAGFFIGGAGLSAFGLLTGKLWGEAVGLPPASMATLGFGVVILLRSSQGGVSIAALIIGMMFVAYACGIVGRWLDVMTVIKISGDTR